MDSKICRIFPGSSCIFTAEMMDKKPLIWLLRAFCTIISFTLSTSISLMNFKRKMLGKALQTCTIHFAAIFLRLTQD